MNAHSILASAHSTLQQPSPPSVREILAAYRSRGDGDRDMLLALLNAKTAEDQRLSSVLSLHKTMLDIYQSSYHEPYRNPLPPPPPAPAPAPSSQQDPHRPPKRPRSSRSPYSTQSVPHPSSGHYPLSPYSSDRTDSADCSPRSRNSMTIGNLLSSSSEEPPRDAD